MTYIRGELAPGADWYGHGGDLIRLREPIAPQKSVYPSRQIVWSKENNVWIESLPGRGAAAYTTGLVSTWKAERPHMRLGQLPSFGDFDFSDVGGFADKIVDLIQKIPTSNPKYQVLQAGLDECLEKLEDGDPISLYSGGKCLYSLYKDAQAAVSEEEKKSTLPKPQPPIPVKTGMDLTTVALVAAAGVGIALLVS